MEHLPDGAQRAQILTANFEAPNPDDSFRSFVEQVLEDVIVGGFGAVEIDRFEGWSLDSAMPQRALPGERSIERAVTRTQRPG